MKRKEFIKRSSIAAAGLPVIVAASFQPNQKKYKKGKIMSDINENDFELNEITISELQEKMQKGELTSEKITILYLKRIEEIDKNGPALNSIIELNPDALTIAKAMDEERNSGKVRGPMHGIPVVIKDNIDTADKMMTTAGSLAMVGYTASGDAYLVNKLRDAGAVILGKSNLSEWANFRSNKSCSGWSSRGGQTKNPYYLDRNPCGSSSGSGVAVAANLCTVAVGTETDGSVTCPASVNGVVGIKPTVGLISRAGIIPISFTQDTAGPLARTVTDAAILLSAMSGIDPSDKITKESEGKTVSDYSKYLNANGLKGKRIGVEKKKYENQFAQQLSQKALNTLREQGAEIIELDYLDKLNELGDAEFEVLKFEFKYSLNEYLSGTDSAERSLKEIIDFNKLNEDKVMPTFKQDIFEECEKKDGLNSNEYKEALNKSHTGSRKILDDLIKEYSLDAFAGLTMGPACSIDIIYGDRWGEIYLTSPAAMSGYPHISVPAGKIFDLPVGLSFFSGAYKEAELISMAYAYEQASKNRVRPEFKKTLSI